MEYYAARFYFTERKNLFPLNSGGGLARDVIYDSVDACYLIDDPVGGVCQQFMRQAGPVGGHKVLGGDNAQGDCFLIGALVAHYSY